MDPIEAFFGGVVACVFGWLILSNDQTTEGQKASLLLAEAGVIGWIAFTPLWWVFAPIVACGLLAWVVLEKKDSTGAETKHKNDRS